MFEQRIPSSKHPVGERRFVVGRGLSAKLRSLSGQAFTVEFAIAIVGAVALAFVTARVGDWAFTRLEQIADAFNSTRVDAGQPLAGYVSPPVKGLDPINLISGGETLGAMASSPKYVNFATYCDAPGPISAGLTYRQSALNAVTSGKAMLLIIEAKAQEAFLNYKKANEMRADWELIKDSPNDCKDCSTDPVTGIETCNTDDLCKTLTRKWGVSKVSQLWDLIQRTLRLARLRQTEANQFIGGPALAGQLGYADIAYMDILSAEASERTVFNECKVVGN